MADHHTLAAFDTDIERLRSAITTMGGLVERQLASAMNALRSCDEALVQRVLDDEVEVNRLHADTNYRCSVTIATWQPAASDLREIVAVIHISGDLERVGDEAKKIALKSREVCKALAPPSPPGRFDRIATLVSGMLRDSIDAFVRQDGAVFEVLNARDKDVDAQRDELVEELVRTMNADPGVVAPALALVFVAQSLERIGDHARSIAENVAQIVDGTRLQRPF